MYLNVAHLGTFQNLRKAPNYIIATMPSGLVTNQLRGTEQVFRMIVTIYTHWLKEKKQAGAELGQAQHKLGSWQFNSSNTGTS